jgi:hypothetical protein
VPSRLTPARRLTTFEGAPTTLARAGVAVLMAVAAAVGWAAGPDHGDPGTRSGNVIAIHRLSGDLPVAREQARPELRPAAALPPYREAGRRRSAPAVTVEPAATPSATPTPAASAEPTPTPAATIAPVEAPPAPAPAPAPPQPTATPAPTFDSSG